MIAKRERRPQRSAVTISNLYAWAEATWRTLFRLLACGAIIHLSACSPQLPPVSADTSCERFRHISFTDAQIKAVEAAWELWESAADQIVAHNVTYDEHCLPVVK